MILIFVVHVDIVIIVQDVLDSVGVKEIQLTHIAMCSACIAILHTHNALI